MVKQKFAKLRANLAVENWLKDFKVSLAPLNTTTKQFILVEYYSIMNLKLTEWPSGGPGAWLANWEDLMGRAQQFNIILENWLTDVSLIWQWVPGIASCFDDREQKVVQEKQYKYLPADISVAIQQYWKHQMKGTVLKFLKPKVTRLAFFTSNKFDKKKILDTIKLTVTFIAANKNAQSFNINIKNKNKNKRRKNNWEEYINTITSNHSQSQLCDQSQGDTSHWSVPKSCPHLQIVNKTKKKNRKHGRESYLKSDDTNYFFTRFYLILGQDKDWILVENQKTFRSNMKVVSFKKTVDNFKSSQKSFEDWYCMDERSVKEKIMGGASTFFY